MNFVKNLISLALFLSLVLPAAAAPYWSSPTPNVSVFTNSISLTFTNSQTVTNIQGTKESVNHTFHIFAATSGSNVITANLDRTLDGSNWIPVSTNTISTNGYAEIIAPGKWAQYRWRVTALTTNAALTENYFAQ